MITFSVYDAGLGREKLVEQLLHAAFEATELRLGGVAIQAHGGSPSKCGTVPRRSQDVNAARHFKPLETRRFDRSSMRLRA